MLFCSHPSAFSHNQTGVNLRQIPQKMVFSKRQKSPLPFPIYLLPPIPFRRRSSSAQSTSEASTSSPSSPTSPSYLSGHSSRIRCSRCATDLCFTNQIISKGFTGRHGRAYLVSPESSTSPPLCLSNANTVASLPNTHTHKAVPRQLVTGAHTVSDVSCAFCGCVLGWKYISAEEESQRYKVGKYILETRRISTSSCWEHDEAGEAPEPQDLPPTELRTGALRWAEDAVEFDSQDEDECEDLFAGIWSPTLATKRRRGRRFSRGTASSYTSHRASGEDMI